METHSSIPVWEIPDRGSWWAEVHGVRKSRARLSHWTNQVKRFMDQV